MQNKDTDSEELQRLIGERIRQLRKEKGYSSFERIAWESNINRSQWGKYEKGSKMELTTFFRILNALQVNFDEFFDKTLNEALGKMKER